MIEDFTPRELSEISLTATAFITNGEHEEALQWLRLIVEPVRDCPRSWRADAWHHCERRAGHDGEHLCHCGSTRELEGADIPPGIDPRVLLDVVPLQGAPTEPEEQRA